MGRDLKSLLTQERDALRERVQELEARVAQLEGRPASLADWTSRSPAERLWGRQAVAYDRHVECLSGIGSWAWDSADDKFEVSAEFNRVLSLPDEARLGGFARFVEVMHPEDQPLLRQLPALLRGAVGPARVDVRVDLGSGTVRDVTVIAEVLPGEAPLGQRVLGVVVDATEQAECRREMQNASEHLNESQKLAQVGSWLVDLDTGATEWTPETYRILGLGFDVRPSRELLLECIHPEDREEMRSLEAEAFQGQPFEQKEVRILWSGGEVRHVYVAGRVEFDRPDRRDYWGTLMDVSSRRSLEQQLQQAQKLEALGRLSGSIAHDFNNLLTVILLNTTMLRVAQPERRELAQIEEAAVQAASVTGQLLAFSRRSVRRLRAVDVNVLVQEALQWLARILGERITMSFTPAKDPVVVSCDESQLRQVLLNLVVNARDAMPEGGELRVSIHSELRAEQGIKCPYACIRVADTGIGMDAHTRSRAFEPFFSTKQPGQGSGLGLATVFGIVRQHEGYVDVVSAPEQGAEFRVWLPLTDQAPAQKAKVEPAIAPRGRETLLLVEDERLVRLTMSTLLTDAGYEVLSAEDPEKALTLWAEHRDRIKLLVTDIVMPGMSGGQLAQRLRTDCEKLSVLFVTGYDPQAEAVCMERTWSITKPFEPNRLLETVRMALEAGADAPVDGSTAADATR